MIRALAGIVRESDEERLVELTLEVGRIMIAALDLLDRSNASRYGEPGPTEVPLGVRGNPGILVTGHDLQDMEELLEQTDGTGGRFAGRFNIRPTAGE